MFKKYKLISLLLLKIFFIYLLSCSAFSDDLSLRQALELAIKNNKRLGLISEARRLDILQFRLRYLALYVPNVNLGLNVGQNKTLFQVPSSSRDSASEKADPTTKNHYTKDGEITLEVTPALLYDFGITENAKDRIEKEKENKNLYYEQQIRDIVFSVIDQYYDFVLKKENLEIVKRRNDIAQSIFLLMKQKQKVGKASSDDVTYAKREILVAQKASGSADSAFKISMMRLLNLVFWPLDKKIVSTDNLQFIRLKIKEEDVLNRLNLSPSFITAKNDMEITKLDAESSARQFVPVPTFKLSGYKIGKGFSDSSQYNNHSYGTTSSNQHNFDIRLEAGITIPLWSDKGFLNYLGREQVKLSVQTREVEVEQLQRDAILNVKSLMNRFQESEEQIISNKQQLDASSTILDGVMTKFQKGEVERSELKDANAQLTDNNLSYISSIKDYISLKMELAKLLGDEKFLELSDSIGEKK
jgi:outer membrane protein TolC